MYRYRRPVPPGSARGPYVDCILAVQRRFAFERRIVEVGLPWDAKERHFRRCAVTISIDRGFDFSIPEGVDYQQCYPEPADDFSYPFHTVWFD